MFKAKDVLKPEFIEQPLDKLWSLISPLYMVDESRWLEQLLPLATPTMEEKTAIADQNHPTYRKPFAPIKSIWMMRAASRIRLGYSGRRFIDVFWRSSDARSDS